MSLLEDVDWPQAWERAPLWSMFQRVKDLGHPDEQMLSVYRDHGVVRKDDRTDNFNKTALNRDIYQLIDDGWLALNRMKAWQGAVGISTLRGIVSGHYICFRPTHDSEPRFLHYLIRSPIYTAEMQRISRGVRPSQIEIDNDQLRVLQLRLPSLDLQRRIADFLDAETARIDALITAKQQMLSQLDARDQAARSAWWASCTGSYGTTALRRLGAKVEQGWSPICDAGEADADEWGVLKTSSVSSGVFDVSANKRLPSTVDPELRWQVMEGDLLMVRGSGSRSAVGAVAVAKPGRHLLTISDLLYRIRGLKGSPAFHAAALRSPQVRQVIEGAFRTDAGQTLKLRSADVLDLPHPSVPVEQMDSALAQLAAVAGPSRELVKTLETQIALLRERRQALITAAVTGEIEV